MQLAWYVQRLAFKLTTAVLLGAAGVALLIGSTAFASGTVAQPTQNPNAGTETRAAAYCQDFIAHLSQAVNVSQSRLQGDLAKAARQTVDDALAKRDITNQQASTIDAQLSKGSICTHPGMGAGMGAGKGAGTNATAYCEDFIGHLSRAASISQGRIQQGLAMAAGQTIDDAVAKGDMTNQQAASIKTQLTKGSICNAHFPTSGMKRAMSEGLTAAAATALGTNPDRVRSQLDQGKGLSEIAPAGMTEQQFATGLSSAIKTQLDARVHAGTLTQSQENQVLERVPALANRLWNQGGQVSRPQTPTPPQGP